MRPVAFVSSIDYGHLGKLLQEPPLVFSLPVSNWRSQCRRCLAMLQTKKAVYPCSRQACNLIVAGARRHGVHHDMCSVYYELACSHVGLDQACVFLELCLHRPNMQEIHGGWCRCFGAHYCCTRCAELDNVNHVGSAECLLMQANQIR